MSSHRRVLSFAAAGALAGFLFAACGQPTGKVACTLANCGGCCDAQGICQGGDKPAACGVDGKTCAICNANEGCAKGVCVAGSGTGGGTGGSAGTGGSGTGGATTGGGTGTGGALDNCAAEARLVYVVDQDKTLSSFDPRNVAAGTAFKDLGKLNCPAQSGAEPFSMSVDRNAIAWVIYDSGELFTVNVKATPLTCTKTGFSPNNGLAKFGMGFVANAAGSDQETLFVSGGSLTSTMSTSKLATLMTTAPYTASVIATLTGSPELTGTGDAKLWSFFPDLTPPKVAQLDKTTGALVPSATFTASALNGTPTAWAFAFWGGDFFIFLERTSDWSTNVWRMNGQTGAVTEVLHDTGRTIVGAGVSTCAPITFN